MSQEFWNDSEFEQEFSGAGYDPESVRFFDIAHEGAQVRAIAAAVDSGQLAPTQARSLVVIPTDRVARACAHFVAEQAGGASGQALALQQPFMVCDRLPAFVGALDTVVVIGERADDLRHLQALVDAARRGARTILVAPERGVLVEEAPEDCVVIPPLPGHAGPSPARYICALEALAGAYGDGGVVVQEHLAELVAALDDILVGLATDKGEELNVARQLADVAAGPTIHVGAVAPVVAALWATVGRCTAVLEPEEIPAARERAGGQAETDPFYDPLIDGPRLVGSKVIMWADSAAAAELAFGPDVFVVRPDRAQEHPLGLIVRAFAATAYDPS